MERAKAEGQRVSVEGSLGSLESLVYNELMEGVHIGCGLTTVPCATAEAQILDFRRFFLSPSQTPSPSSHHVTIRFWLRRCAQVLCGCQECRYVAIATRNGHDQCPRPDHRTSPSSLPILEFPCAQILTPLVIENQRELLRRLRSRAR